MESRMYANPQEINRVSGTSARRNRICSCEYMHDMGNSLGGMKSYIDLWTGMKSIRADLSGIILIQALWWKMKSQVVKVLRYGGDFDDRPRI